MAGHGQQGREVGEYDHKDIDRDNEDSGLPPFVPAFGTPTAQIEKRKFSSKSDVASRHSSSSEPERSNEQPSRTPEEGHRSKRPRIEKDGSSAKTSGRPRKRTPDSAWQGNRMTPFLRRFGDITTEETSEILRQKIRIKQTELGSRIYGLEDSMNESFRNRVFMVLSEEAVSIPRRPEIPIGFRVKVGMAFWERAVGFSHDEDTPIGDHAAGSALGKTTTKRRLHIVRAILGDDKFLTTCVETHGERGLHAPYISPDTYWQWLRVADARDRNPTNHGPHGVLKLDTSQAKHPVRISDMSYVFAGVSSQCTLTEHWDFAGYLDEDSVTLLEALSKRVTTSQRDDKMDHDLYHSMDWRAIDDGRKAKGLAAYPRPERRSSSRRTKSPQPLLFDDESDNDRRRFDHRRRSHDRQGRDHRASSRKDRGYSNTASYEKDRPQRPRDSDTRSSRPRSGKGNRADQYDDIDRSKADGPRGDHATEGTQSWKGAVQGIRAGSVYVGPNYYSRESTGRTDRMNDDDGPPGSRGLGGYYDRS